MRIFFLALLVAVTLAQVSGAADPTAAPAPAAPTPIPANETPCAKDCKCMNFLGFRRETCRPSDDRVVITTSSIFGANRKDCITFDRKRKSCLYSTFECLKGRNLFGAVKSSCRAHDENGKSCDVCKYTGIFEEFPTIGGTLQTNGCSPHENLV